MCRSLRLCLAPVLLVVALAGLRGVSAAGDGARHNTLGNRAGVPPQAPPEGPQVTITSPPGGAASSEIISVKIEWCDDNGLDEQTISIWLGGTDVTSQFTIANGDAPSCTAQHLVQKHSTGTITLAPGQNTLTATIDDIDGWTGSDSESWSRPAPRVVLTAAVTADAGVRVQRAGGVSDSAAFTMTNTGTESATFSLATACETVVSGCTLSTSSVALAVGASQGVRVRYITGASAGAIGLVRLIALVSGARVDSSWTEVRLESAPQPGVTLISPVGALDHDLCVSIAAGAQAASQCGDLRVAHDLPVVRTLGVARAPSLLYSVGTARPRPLVAADVVVPSSGGQVPLTVTARVLIGGVERATGSWNGSDWGGANVRRRIVVPVDDTTLATGAHDFTLEVTYTGNGTWSGVTVPGTLPVVNRSASPYGAGWWIAGLERVIALTGNRLVWIAGDGSARLYAQDPLQTTVYRAPRLERPDSITWDGAAKEWTRWAPMRARIVFDSLGRHARSTSRLGYSTTFTYQTAAADAPLSALRLPVPAGGPVREYTFAYTAGALSSVTAPGNRLTSVYRVASVIDSIVDPDLTRVAFTYGTGAHAKRLASRKDRRNQITTYTYDAASRLAMHALALGGLDTIRVTIAAAETRGVPGSGWPAAQPLDSIYTRIDGPRTDVSDLTRFWTTAYGAPFRVRDAHGRETVVTYDTAWIALAAAVRDASGLRTRAAYDARGLLATRTVENPLGDGQDAVTGYVWHATYEAPTKIKAPLQDTVRFDYDGDGNRLWQQAGDDVARRVRFTYNAQKLLDSLVAPHVTGTSAVELFTYDSLGNVTRVRDPLGYSIRLAGDAFGRDTLVVTPIHASDVSYGPLGDDTLRLRERTTYDAAGRVRRVERLAPRMPAPGACSLCVGPGTATYDVARTLVVETDYDAEGNVLTVHRWVTPKVGGVGGLHGVPTAAGTDSAATTSVYDAAGRKTQETDTSSPWSRKFGYDLAGNLTREVTKLGDTLVMTYDATGQLTTRVAPSRFYPRALCTTSHVPDANGRHSPCVVSFDSLRIPADTARFRYDLLGRLVIADNGDARITRSYFPGGRLAVDELRLRQYGDFLFSSTVYDVRPRYDLAGRRTELRYPATGGTSAAPADTVRYAYYSWGPLREITGLSGETYTTDYDAAGRPIRLTLPGAVRDSSVFDAAGRLARRVVLLPGAAGDLIDDTLTYDARGKTTTGAMTGLAAEGGGEVATWYDGLGAVMASTWRNTANAGLETDEVRTDALGHQHWMHKATSGTMNDTLVAEYDDWGRVVTIRRAMDSTLSARRGTYSFRDYDQAGNVSYGAEDVFSSPSQRVKLAASRSYYAADGKLRRLVRRVSSVSDDLLEEYFYDALGRRVLVRTRHEPFCSQSDPALCYSAITRTVWDGHEVLLELRAPGGTGANVNLETGSGAYAGRVAYVHGVGIDRPLAVLKAGSALVVPHVNWRGLYIAGTTTSGTQTTAAITWHGARVRVGLEGGRLDGDWYGGLLKDQLDASGMLYRRARYYDPQTGKFTQEDPIGLAGGLNLYGFANGDPVNFSDPFGLCAPWCIVLALRAAPIIFRGAQIAIEALDPNPDVGSSLVQGGGRLASRAAHAAQGMAASLKKSWTTQRRAFWKAESGAEDAAERWGGGELGARNVERMKKGLAPEVPDLDGKVRSVELSHEPVAKRDGGTQVVPRTPLDHQAVDPYRHVNP